LLFFYPLRSVKIKAFGYNPNKNNVLFNEGFKQERNFKEFKERIKDLVFYR
jgi:hypothetical protein